MLDANFTYSRDLFQGCKSQDVRFIYASSAAVYGNKPTFTGGTPSELLWTSMDTQRRCSMAACGCEKYSLKYTIAAGERLVVVLIHRPPGLPFSENTTLGSSLAKSDSTICDPVIANDCEFM
ncbi:NAD-dependent epimerase/dehydratase [Penicillium concentricum]|uniref:NAD-dependent epimerase/dehydratase n=1 Tax=Penicillium concentricum TaxID=293559 RepID=A0A9W9VLK2_9EURO|nr:NAD-dependent epimerase/dehydratase [Penicillium concentricum]KAJ5384746.1 NAD-dependent epimerase/dehydratase [Penicillium concentricum]